MQRTFERSSGNGARAIALAAIVVLVAAGWLLTRHSESKPAASSAADVPAPIELAPADIASVSLLKLTQTLPISGALGPLVQTTLKARVAGDIMEISVREGQAVHRGDLLERIDTRNLKAQFDSQQAALDKARADLALAKLNRDNNAAMLHEHYISQNAYDTADSAYQADLASVKVAEAQLRLAQIALEDADVRSPIDGFVAKRLAQPGEKVNTDSSLMTLVDLSHMELQALAPASEIPTVHVGQTAHFHVGGFGDRLFEGRVDRINPIAEEGSRSITVYLEVANLDGALRGGMFAQGDLTLDQTAPTPAMPSAAVHDEAGLPFVFVFADGKIVRRAITIGLASEEQGLVEVRSGVKPGEQVIVAKIDSIKDGTAAVVKVPAPAGAKDPAAAAVPAKV
jgi:RND family efflux transporter MFP subunit